MYLAIERYELKGEARTSWKISKRICADTFCHRLWYFRRLEISNKRYDAVKTIKIAGLLYILFKPCRVTGDIFSPRLFRRPWKEIESSGLRRSPFKGNPEQERRERRGQRR